MATVSSIVSNSAVDAQGLMASARTPKNELGQDDFLKLLVTKMSAQDPMNPQADTDFIAQMAQFSSLEQAKSMTTDMDTLRAQQQVLTANGLIGRNVTVTKSDHTQASGMVTGVSVDSGSPQVVINGAKYSLDSVTSISPYTAAV
jgi:flagellar basal-body rod modification protein FlgD